MAWYAAVFSLLNAGVLWVRIRAEDRALQEARERSV
jgi:isoprenylcysteine carboxyl methyltransferase (ICMT) family protein YpbQ